MGVNPRLECVRVGNLLWAAAIEIFLCALRAGVHATIEHPTTSYAWRCPNTLQALKVPGVKAVYLDACAYAAPLDVPHRKPLRLLTCCPWIELAAKRCPGTHEHAPHLCGSAAKNSARYTQGMVNSLAHACAGWSHAASPAPSL